MPNSEDYSANEMPIGSAAGTQLVAGLAHTFYRYGLIFLCLVCVSREATANNLQGIGATQLLPAHNFIGQSSPKIDILYSCSEIIGKIFNDENRDGDQDSRESGLPDVTIVAVKGFKIATDNHGLFHFGCTETFEIAPFSKFILKIDTHSLPFGYYLIDENPRVVVLTPGKVTKLSFRAALAPIVRFELKDSAFENGQTTLKVEWLVGLTRLIAVLQLRQSILQMTYRTGEPDQKLAFDRLSKLEHDIEDRWEKSEGSYKLSIDARIAFIK